MASSILMVIWLEYSLAMLQLNGTLIVFIISASAILQGAFLWVKEMTFRIVYRGCIWGNPWQLQRKYKYWPWWVNVWAFSSVAKAEEEANKLRLMIKA